MDLSEMTEIAQVEFNEEDHQLSDLLSLYGIDLYEIVMHKIYGHFSDHSVYAILCYRYFSPQQRKNMLDAFIENRPKVFERPFQESELMEVLEQLLTPSYRFKNIMLETFLALKPELQKLIPDSDPMKIDILRNEIDGHGVLIISYVERFEPVFSIFLLHQSFLMTTETTKELTSRIRRSFKTHYNPSLRKPVDLGVILLGGVDLNKILSLNKAASHTAYDLLSLTKVAFAGLSPSNSSSLDVQNFQETQSNPIFEFTYAEIATWLRTIAQLGATQNMRWILEDFAVWVEHGLASSPDTDYQAKI